MALFNIVFSIAKSIAGFDMSKAVTSQSNSLLKAIAIAPLPVQISIILGFKPNSFINLIVLSTNHSVSKRGISTLSSTFI